MRCRKPSQSWWRRWRKANDWSDDQMMDHVRSVVGDVPTLKLKGGSKAKKGGK